MPTTQHQVILRFVTDDAEDFSSVGLEDALVELTTDLEDLGATRVRTRYETRRNGFGQGSVTAAPDTDGDEA